MIDIPYLIQLRINRLERKLEQGVFPGELDTYEHHQLIGGIKELKKMLEILSPEEEG